ncbi:MAG: hypothetical protein Q8L60_03915 [Gammaproteobacteria bacterium]|nr:hypothetical protein [Gammaproteobacteria bacterium]MDP2139937.1 hypothetical protein [Gammaproteobacteria bacterium]MDP2347757.1 hypothetical protein [Gammaproteobacteria bacterium]
MFRRKVQAPGLTGLALGDQHFTLAHVTRQRDQILLDQCVQVEFRNPQQLRETLPGQVAEMNLQGSACNAVLGARDYNLYLVESPAVEPDELRAAVRWKIKDLIDIPAEDAVIDIFPVPEDAFQGRSKMLYVVAAVKSRVEQLIELCQRADLELAAIDIPEMAMRNITQRFANDDNSLAFVALKSQGSTMNITRHGNLYLARKINTQLGPNVVNSHEWESLRDRLVLEIQRSLDYYESQMGQDPVSRILIAPRGNDTQAIVESLREAMSVPVAALDFAAEFESSAEISDETKNACMLVLGASLRSDLLMAGG